MRESTRRIVLRGPYSEPEPRLNGYSAHAGRGSHFAKRERIHRGIDGGVIHVIENIVGGNTQLEHARILNRNRAIERHVERDAARAFDDVAPRVAKACAGGVDAIEPGRAKRSRVEPFLRRGIADRDGLPGNNVGAKRAADAAVDVEGATEHARAEIKARSYSETPAPLPFAEETREHTLVRERAIFAEGQIENPISGEFMCLVKAGKTSVGGNIESILSDDYSATADGRGVVERFGEDILRANAEAFGHAFAHANRRGVKNGIAFRRLKNERLAICDDECPLGVEPRALRTVEADVENDAAGQFALNIEIPDLDVSERVVRIDAEIVRDGAR